MKILINVSNHPVLTWKQEQRKGYDVIQEIPFPFVPGIATEQEVNELKEEVMKKLVSMIITYQKFDVDVYVAGEYSLSYMILIDLIKWKNYPFKIVVPSSDRIIKEDGTRDFVFCMWRTIYESKGGK